MSVMYNKYIFGRRVFKMAEATKKVNVKDATAKTAATTATAAKATTTKATTTKTAAKAATAKKTTTTKKATTAKKTAAKKTTAKKTTTKKAATKKAAVVETLNVQWDGKTFESNDVVKRCKDDFKNANKRKAIDEINVYINVNDSTAYYVVKSAGDEYQGKVVL